MNVNVLSNASHLSCPPSSTPVLPRIGPCVSKPEEPAAEPPIEVLALTAIDITKASLSTTSDVLTIEEILEFFLDGTDPEVVKAVEAVEKASVE